MTPPPGVFWIASFPKSGNTWMRALLANLAAAQGEPQDINELTMKGGIASSRSRFEETTLLDSYLLRPDEMRFLRPAVYDAFARTVEAQAFIKTHDAYSYLSDGTPLLGRAARGALYMVRDPRDVALSLSAHMGCTLDDAIRMLNNRHGSLRASASQMTQELRDWSGHVRSWRDQEETPVHMVRYEDLLTDTEREFRTALGFLGIPAEDAAISRAVAQSDFSELSRQEKQKGFREASESGSPFFRQGRAQAWREAITREQADAVESVHRDTMKEFGYL
jgi:aryl sulfotransferase